MNQWVDGKGYVNMNDLAKEHTALPWEIMTPADTTDGLARFVRTERKGAIVECRYDGYIDKEEAEANARFIVTACNHFEEMYEALKAIAMCGFKREDGKTWAKCSPNDDDLERAHALLTRIEGEK